MPGTPSSMAPIVSAAAVFAQFPTPICHLRFSVSFDRLDASGRIVGDVVGLVSALLGAGQHPDDFPDLDGYFDAYDEVAQGFLLDPAGSGPAAALATALADAVPDLVSAAVPAAVAVSGQDDPMRFTFDMQLTRTGSVTCTGVNT